ncbi:MAG: amino acid adenylation domain-containing protein [Pseudomonadota bacterium]
MNASLPENVEAVLPLSPVQSGILFHCIGAQTQGTYVGVVSTDILGPLDAARFRAAFRDTVMASDALRASFVWDGVKRPLQVIHKAVEVPWAAFDWQDLSPDEQAARSQALVAQYQSAGFDLAKGPLMQVAMVRLGPETARLIWAVHHIVSDGWSTRSVLDDVLSRYNDPRSVAPRAQFRDYLGWLKSRDASKDEAFWRAYLAGITEPTRIDVLSGMLADPGEAHRHLSHTMPPEVLEGSERLCRDIRITQNTLMSTVWALVLRRYARSDDIVFGATNAGRPVDLGGADRAAGAFLNTLPVRFQFDAAEAVSELLQSAEAAMRARRAFEASALADVQAWSDLPAGIPIFDYVFAFERLPPVQAVEGALRIGRLETVQTSHFPLTVLVTPDEGLLLEVYYDPAAFSDAVVEAMLSDFEGLLRAVIRTPSALVGDLSEAYPDLPRPDSVEVPFATVSEAIAVAAEGSPDAPAVSDASGTITYSALADEVARVSEMLAAAGVERGDLVPVALPRGIPAIAAFLGVMKSGAAYIPLDVTYPEERIRQVLENAPHKVILTASDVPRFGSCDRLCIDDPEAARVPVKAAPAEGDIAYVIYTSGSQGAPKGVPIHHAALAHSTIVRNQVYGGPPETFLLLSSLAFDSSVVGIFWTLTTGGHLVIGDPELVQDPPRLASVVVERNVRTLLCLPRLYEALLGTGAVAQLRGLETVIVAGEAVSPSLLDAHRSAGMGGRLLNEYGPTEATVWCCMADLTDRAGDASVPIGRPIPGVTMAVCDRDGRPLPDGVAGEIVVAGPTVSHGYLGQGTDAVSPFRTHKDGLQSYRTGDLGVRGADGMFLFLGREDDQVKIRGHRVEIGDLEHCARSVAAPADVCAVVMDRDAGASLVLCVEAAQTAGLEQAMQNAFQSQLPAFARPAQMHWMDRFPTLPNGKVDRRALADAVRSAPAAVSAGTLPVGDTETRLAAIWGDVLGCGEVTREADFFDLGGDSLMSIGLFAKAEQAGLPILPTDVFEHPTLQELSAALVRRSAEDDAAGPAEAPLKFAHLDGIRTPVFLLHCNMWIYRQIARGLGPKWPVGLQFSHHFHGSDVALGARIEGFAAETIGNLKSMRAEGPYILCGYSAGAMITLEIARQLRAQGHDVPLVCLIDPPYDGRSQSGGQATEFAMQGVSLARGLASRTMERFAQDSERHRRNVVSQAYALAMRRYRVAPYDGPVHVLVTEDNPAMASGGTLSNALTAAEVDVLPFDHKALLTDDEARLSLTSRIVSRIKRL